MNKNTFLCLLVQEGERHNYSQVLICVQYTRTGIRVVQTVGMSTCVHECMSVWAYEHECMFACKHKYA